MMSLKAKTLLHNPAYSIAFTLLWAGPMALATDRYVATTGSDVANTCTVSATPCLTVQYAINQSVSGDVIHIAAGTYPVAGLITVNKTLTFLGAQAGVDARTRVGPESVLSNTQGISVSASNVVFDGLTIQDSSVSALTGYGIWLNPGVDGTQIVNTIFQNNIVGLGLSNAGTSQCLIQHNLFQNNNLSGGASGTGIYTDQFVGGAVSNVLINENRFVNNHNAGIGFSSTDTTRPDTGIIITKNVIDQCGRGIYFFNTQSSSVTDNTITNLTAPTDGGSSVGVGVFGAVSNLSILRNDIETGVKYGIRIGTFITGTPPPPNTNILIHLNNIFGFAVAGLFVDVAPVGPINYATCNWWGSATGPTNPTLNPGGTGDRVDGDLVAANFNPWLIGLAPDAPCGKENITHFNCQFVSFSKPTGLSCHVFGQACNEGASSDSCKKNQLNIQCTNGFSITDGHPKVLQSLNSLSIHGLGGNGESILEILGITSPESRSTLTLSKGAFGKPQRLFGSCVLSSS